MSNFPTREELVEDMKKAYEEAYISHEPTAKTVAPFALSIDWFPPSEKLMEAALDALLARLPLIRINTDGMESPLTQELRQFRYIYQQLLSYRRE